MTLSWYLKPKFSTEGCQFDFKTESRFPVLVVMVEMSSEFGNLNQDINTLVRCTGGGGKCRGGGDKIFHSHKKEKVHKYFFFF